MAEPEIRVHRVEPLGVLNRIGPDLLRETDAAALVASQVDDDAGALIDDRLEREVELPPAVAASRAEDVTCQALGVHPDQNVGCRIQLAVDDGQMFVAVDEVAVD